MNALTALMIGWGVFWLLVWSGLYAVFSYLQTVASHAGDEQICASRNDAEVALGCWVMALAAVFWIAAWAVVRSIAV